MPAVVVVVTVVVVLVVVVVVVVLTPEHVSHLKPEHELGQVH